MASIYVFIFVFIFVFHFIYCDYNYFFNDDKWSAPRMIEQEGYECEVHNVTTEDGYILTVHRIPSKGVPVLIVHGFLADSALWLVTGKGRSLAYLLSDEGYDVWLGNIRGNSYGLNHVYLNISDAKFWSFSYDEMALYDLPAIIEYVWNSTKQHQIYIGHSQGTLTSFIMAIKRPEIANKLKILISLGPAAYLGHMKPIPTRLILWFFLTFRELLETFGISNAFTQNTLFKLGCELFKIEEYTCFLLMTSFVGFEGEQIDMVILEKAIIEKISKALLPAVINHFPSGTSIKNIVHYAQGVQNHRFASYDYGKESNFIIYNASNAPEYNLRKVFRPIALLYSKSDVIIRPPDLNKLIQLCPNIVDQYSINHSGFTHMDFMWGKNAKELVYDHIIKIMDKYKNL